MTITIFLFLAVIGGVILLNVFVKSIILNMVNFFIIIALITSTASDIEWLRWAFALLLIFPIFHSLVIYEKI
jgi:hypothetical protein